MKTRLPLQIGIQSLFSLALACGTFVPGLLLLLLTAYFLFVQGFYLVLALLVSQGWMIGLVVVGVEIWLLVMGVRHLRFAVRTRPADVWIDDDGLYVDGGRMHGTTVRWVNCRGVDEEADAEEIDIESPTNLVVRTEGHGNRRIVVGQALDGTELASLRALRETIEAKLGPTAEQKQQASLRALREDIEARHSPTGAAPVEAAQTQMLCCPACSAPCAPQDADATACTFCGASVPVPAALRERLRAMTEVVASSKIARRLLPKLLDQPGARMTSLLMLAVGIPIALAWVLAVVFAVVLWREHGLRTSNIGALSVAASVIVVGSYYLLRFWLVNRMALGVITLQYGAFAPAKEGEPWRCRSCDGPLTTTGDSLVVRCVWCESDNVLGIDVRPNAEGARRERKTLEAAFERRTADRKKYGLNLAIAVALLPFAVWLFVRGTGPLDADSRLAIRCAHGDGEACLQRAKSYAADRDEQISEYGDGCLDGVEGACLAYADTAYTQDLWRTTAMLRMSCDRDQLGSCVKLAELIARDGAKDWATPESLFKQACDGGLLTACAPYALALLDRHADRDARAVLERACSAKDALACGRLGLIVEDPNRAAALMSIGCPADPVSCNGLGEAYWNGRGVPIDHNHAADFFKTACDAGVGVACRRRGDWASEVAPNRDDVIVTWYDAACRYDDLVGCMRRGDIELKTSSWTAFKTYKMVCYDRNYGPGCTAAGRLRRDGAASVQVNGRDAAQLFDAGCKLDDAASCNERAQLSHDEEDYTASHPLFVKACKLGSQNGCNWAAFEIEKGQGAPIDPAAARALYAQTCAQKPETDETKYACEQLPK